MAGSGTAHLRAEEGLLLRVRDLVVDFPARGGDRVHAVSDVSFDVAAGETLGLVGESGCGKSTTALAVTRLVDASAGTVEFEGVDLTGLTGQALRRVRPRIQMVFQDPGSSVNPRRQVRDIVAEPLRVWRRDQRSAWGAIVEETLDAVGLDPATVGERWPRQLSGGQLQRVCIARALVMEPSLVVCDEPVSALDVSVQAQILNLLRELKRRYRLTLVFVAHDLAVVKNIADRVAVMYLGKLCEVGRVDEVYAAPTHPYTAALLASVPHIDGARRRVFAPLAGDVPSPLRPPSGCRFRTRCPRADARCADEEPRMRPVGTDQFVACHYPLDPTAEPGGTSVDAADTRS